MSTLAPPPLHSRPHRFRRRRRRRTHRRAVDDEHRHGRHRVDRPAGPGPGARRLGAGARHRQHRRSRGRSAAHRASGSRALASSCRIVGDFHFNGHRLLKAHPACAAGAGEVPHQSRQRRPRQQARSAVRRDDRGRVPQRQAGAHRRELGQPRSGPADAPDGRELASARSRSMPTRSCARRWSSRRSNPRSAPWSSGSAATASSSRARSAACRT